MWNLPKVSQQLLHDVETVLGLAMLIVKTTFMWTVIVLIITLRNRNTWCCPVIFDEGSSPLCM